MDEVKDQDISREFTTCPWCGFKHFLDGQFADDYVLKWPAEGIYRHKCGGLVRFAPIMPRLKEN